MLWIIFPQHILQVDLDLRVQLGRSTTTSFSQCSHCNATILKEVLESHERFCHGAQDRQVTPSCENSCVRPGWDESSTRDNICLPSARHIICHSLSKNVGDFVLREQGR